MKYMVDSIRDACLALMTSILPVSLDGLDSVKLHSNRVKFLELAERFDVRFLFPGAYYRLCELKEKQLQKYNPSAEFMLKYYRAKQALHPMYASFIKNEIASRAARHHGLPCCYQVWDHALNSAHKELRDPGFIAKPPNPLKLILSWKTDRVPSGRLCRRCRKNFLAHVDAYRQNIWDSLPQVLGIGSSWDELGVMKGKGIASLEFTLSF